MHTQNLFKIHKLILYTFKMQFGSFTSRTKALLIYILGYLSF